VLPVYSAIDKAGTYVVLHGDDISFLERMAKLHLRGCISLLFQLHSLLLSYESIQQSSASHGVALHSIAHHSLHHHCPATTEVELVALAVSWKGVRLSKECAVMYTCVPPPVIPPSSSW
jgi:hypothetical protein